MLCSFLDLLPLKCPWATQWRYLGLELRRKARARCIFGSCLHLDRKWIHAHPGKVQRVRSEEDRALSHINSKGVGEREELREARGKPGECHGTTESRLATRRKSSKSRTWKGMKLTLWACPLATGTGLGMNMGPLQTRETLWRWVKKIPYPQDSYQETLLLMLFLLSSLLLSSLLSFQLLDSRELWI